MFLLTLVLVPGANQESAPGVARAGTPIPADSNMSLEAFMR